MQTITIHDLVKCVTELATPTSPVVPSKDVKSWCDKRGIDWGGTDTGFSGRSLDQADDIACGRGLLTKWKRKGADNAPVGWSLSDSALPKAATDLALTSGWYRVTVPHGLGADSASDSPTSIAGKEDLLMQNVPTTGETVGNVSLMRQLGWKEEEYWSVRNRLVDRGLLELGKGKGGSVRRVLSANLPAGFGPSVIVAGHTQLQRKETDKELELYGPMVRVIEDSWAADAAFDHKIVQVTAQQGSRPTGKWSRPDIALAAVSSYPYVPGRHFDVVTFEVKTPDSLDITAVYEALAHLRSATRSYVLIHVPADRAGELEGSLVEVYAEAKKHGIGAITAGDPGDYETWDEVVEPARSEPDPRRLNDFLAKQFSRDQLEQIMKWFK